MPSEEYLDLLEQAKKYHRESKTYTGARTYQAIPDLRHLCQQYGAKTLLDYGCGKGEQFKGVVNHHQHSWPNLLTALGVESIAKYDPAWPEYDQLPPGIFDGVYCIDVLNAIPEQDLAWVIELMANKARDFLLVQVGIMPRSKKHKPIVGQNRTPQFYLNALQGVPVHTVVRIKAEYDGVLQRVTYGKPAGGLTWTPQPKPEIQP